MNIRLSPAWGALLLGSLLLATPFSYALAQYQGLARSYGVNSKTRAAIDKLDDSIVKNLPIPVLLGVEVRNLTKNFGDPRDGGTRTHEGLDILAPKWTPIASPTDAVVTSTGNGTDSGLYVRTANPGGETFVFMHLVSFAEGLKAGDVLKRGDVLGFVGNTGNAAGGPTHLHFETRRSGKAQDPYPRLTQVFTATERAAGVKQALKLGGDAEAVALAKNFPAMLSSAAAAGAEVPGSALAASFSRDLEVGMTGQDVLILQVFLNGKGFVIAQTGSGSPGHETTYFGSLTKAALAKYQAANKIVPAAGYFGPLTRGSLALSV